MVSCVRTNSGSLTKKLFAPTPSRGEEENISIAAEFKPILRVIPGEFAKFDICAGGEIEVIREIKNIRVIRRRKEASSRLRRVRKRYREVIVRLRTRAVRLPLINIVKTHIIVKIVLKDIIIFRLICVNRFIIFPKSRGRVAVRKPARTFGWGKVAYGRSHSTFLLNKKVMGKL